jgi:HSP20 family protein
MLSRRAAESLTARVFDSATRTGGCRLDAYREDDTYYVDIDLPGIDPATIDVTVDRTVLTVRAERKRTEREGLRLVVAERPAGAFTRRVFVSDALDTDRLDATYENGVLTLRIPITAQDKPHRVEITPATSPDLAPAA